MRVPVAFVIGFIFDFFMFRATEIAQRVEAFGKCWESEFREGNLARDMSNGNGLNRGRLDLDSFHNGDVLDYFVRFWNFNSLHNWDFLDDFNFLDNLNWLFEGSYDFDFLDDLLDYRNVLNYFNFFDNLICGVKIQLKRVQLENFFQYNYMER